MNLKPLSDGVLVKLESAADRSEGGIIIPDAAQKKSTRGEVLAVGPGGWGKAEQWTVGTGTDWPGRRPVAVTPGQVVLFAKYAGTEVEPDVFLLKESDLLAVVEPEATAHPDRRLPDGPASQLDTERRCY
jgi:chaperonin GroES